nr:serine hydrolase domain-containing protein [Chroococcus sp. FPU101]
MKLHYWVALFLCSFLGFSFAEAKPILKVQKPVIVAQNQKTQKVTEQNVKVALPQLEKLANEMMEKTGVPGMAIAIVYQDRIVYLKGFGIREVGKPDLVDPDTVFQIASVSKPIASTVIAGVVGKGLIEWDDPIIKHDPSFQMNHAFVTNEVTFRDLLAHVAVYPTMRGTT